MAIAGLISPKPADDFMLQQYPNGYLNCSLALRNTGDRLVR